MIKQKARTVIIAVSGFSFAGIDLFAVNGFRDRTEAPGNAPLTVEFLLSFLVQLLSGNKPGHDDHLL